MSDIVCFDNSDFYFMHIFAWQEDLDRKLQQRQVLCV